ncbi:phosphatidylinositol 3 and 4-kinase-domain-containing protein [Russula earlei]|uniref:Phosphatidylinositol 3 and 4-kinase-domain-containing protein n=1 Tax=Russula earlei TaxID=71964 RepID=A0ACC0UEZ6_9AGAM|nr:phosphatidylinositol 3 and 4-kinase-domain-containing protein [Russula earlei]
MPDHSDYQPLPQNADDEPDLDVDVFSSPTSPSRPRVRGSRRMNAPGAIDLRKLDAAFKRWTESIAQKIKRKKKVEDIHVKKDIVRSVFEPPFVSTTTSGGVIKTLDHKPPVTQEEYDALVQSVKHAVSEGIHPKMIAKGSSGSYFARAKVDGRIKTVSVFKPKDEEPYGRLNPKTTKWLHRQFRWIIPFGRSCLIPNLSYISEAAASLLDTRLNLHIVPKTHLVSLSSPAFFYDWIDRTAYKNGKPLPEKIGSMQCFMNGFQDASDFLRSHPWPGRSIADTFDDSTHRASNVTKRFLGAIKVICGRTGAEGYDDEADMEYERVFFDVSQGGYNQPFYWSAALQQSFREELEKHLDYLMLNTDRGADNYMIKYCEAEHEKSLIDIAPTRSALLEVPAMSEVRRNEPPSTSSQASVTFAAPPRVTRTPSNPQTSYTQRPHIHIAAIDNSLSFPHEHPHGWRSYTYGWLYLPVSLIGKPFSEHTRQHFLPLLTSKAWWEDTTYQLRKLFAIDPGFHPKMFNRQLAVIKGQAWNIVQSLKHDDEGPLELTRRTKALVWDDELELEEETISQILQNSHSVSPQASINTLPLPGTPYASKRSRSQSSSSDFPPPIRRVSSDQPGSMRPVPFSAKFQKVHPGTTGVTVLEHLERLDAVEASLERLTAEDVTEEIEQDVGESSSAPRPITATGRLALSDSALIASGSAPSRAGAPELAPVPEADSPTPSTLIEEHEEDVVALSKSLSHLDTAPLSAAAFHHGRGTSSHSAQVANRALDWMQDEPAKKRVVISERLETVTKKPLFWCW